MTAPLRISLLRHGHTNSGAIYRGQVDVTLSERGWQQMRDAVVGLQPDKVISSPLKRCADFAKSMDISMDIDARLVEMNFGRWDGRLREDVWAEDTDAVKAFWQDPLHTAPPEGENLTQVTQRASQALRHHYIEAIANGFSHILIITHGGVIKALVREILQMPPGALFNLDIAYAGTVALHVSPYTNNETHTTLYHVSVTLGNVSNV